MLKHLFLCRHAHTHEAKKDQKDFDRDLTPIGLSEASAVGDFILGFGIKPEAIICSGARRTVKTAEVIAEKIKFDPAQLFSLPELYDAPAAKLLQIIADLSPRKNVAVIVGHNPAVSELATSLINNHRRQVPTGGCCYFSINAPDWQSVEWAPINYKLNF